MKNTIESINHQTRKTYNIIADRYHELFQNELEQKPYDRDLLTHFAQQFSKGMKILDAGCGPSFHIGNYIANYGLKVVGIDISDRCIEIAHEIFPNIEFFRMEMHKLQFPDAYFDGIIAYYSIIDTPKEFIPLLFKEFNRVLQPNGKLLIVVKKGVIEEYIHEILGFSSEIFFALFKEEELRKFFSNGGFQIEFLETREPYPDEIGYSRIYIIGKKK